MNSIKEYIQEKLHINKNTKSYTGEPIESLENESSDSRRSCWIAYSPMNSKGKAQFYKGTFNTSEKLKGKGFHISGPYINRNKSNMVCLMGDFEKNIQYDEKTVVAGTILSHGYMFIAKDKEDLEKFNDKNFLNTLKANCKYQDNYFDIKLKEYLEDNL